MLRIRRLRTGRERTEAAALLAAAGLRMPEGLDALYGALEGDALRGCGGRRGGVICGLAVREDGRGEGVMSALLSEIVAELRQDGHERIFVFTRPESAARFSSLGFHLLAATEAAALLENRRDGLARWLSALPGAQTANNGAIVINGNPFTLGHRHLAREAAARCETLYLFVLSEERSRFTFQERLAMAREGTADIANVHVLPGGPYCISQATFPDYFLKRADAASRVCAELDATLFAGSIAPALGIRVRFAGEEPLDPATAQYNAAMARALPRAGLRFCELPRLCAGGAPVSASRLQQRLDAPDFSSAAALAPESTRPYLIGRLAVEALTAEAEATPKPGLVDQNNGGAHEDMNLPLLKRSAAALGPFFARFAALGQAEAGLPLEGRLAPLRASGMEAERAMLAASGGVNTHRGAIFTLGMLCYLAGRGPSTEPAGLCAAAARLCAGLTAELPEAASHGGRAWSAHGARGARGEAEDGYPTLLRVALPAYEGELARGATDNDALTWALMALIAATEDTNLLHRGGAAGAAYARQAAADFLAAYDPLRAGYAEALRALDEDFISRRLSPGGAADLLAAARFLHFMRSRPDA
ncbi:MAG: GNAT family N-acetyltransferase [Clostridia bacterium]|nr:GNAT family N-acetyltransferase [Clostridia bacterium]